MFKLVEEATIELRSGSNGWTQDIVSIEEAKELIRKGDAEFISKLDDEVVIKRKKRVEMDEKLVHQYFDVLDENRQGLTLPDIRAIEAQTKALK